MKEFKKVSNGYELTITIDEKSLYDELDEEIKTLEKFKADEKKIAEEHSEDPDDYLEGYEYMSDYKYDYGMERVYGDPGDFCTADEIIKDREEFKALIKELIESDGSKLWNEVSLKKNGTFKKNCKPVLKEAINGHYYDESYGWNTVVLRLEPQDDTHVSLELNQIVIHY